MQTLFHAVADSDCSLIERVGLACSRLLCTWTVRSIASAREKYHDALVVFCCCHAVLCTWCFHQVQDVTMVPQYITAFLSLFPILQIHVLFLWQLQTANPGI